MCLASPAPVVSARLSSLPTDSSRHFASANLLSLLKSACCPDRPHPDAAQRSKQTAAAIIKQFRPDQIMVSFDQPACLRVRMPAASLCRLVESLAAGLPAFGGPSRLFERCQCMTLEL